MIGTSSSTESTPPRRDRAQTAQDFAVGIGIFLIAVAFVFGFVPTAISPFEVDAGASEAAQADRAATIIAGNLSVESQPNYVREDELESLLVDTYDDSDAIRNDTGLPFSTRVNVTVREVGADRDDFEYAAGDVNAGQPAESARRVIRTEDPTTCDPACKLIVRVW